jgi:hypothetical protein
MQQDIRTRSIDAMSNVKEKEPRRVKSKYRDLI